MSNRADQNILKSRSHRRNTVRILTGVVLASAILTGTFAVSAQTADRSMASAQLQIAAVEISQNLRPALPGQSAGQLPRNIRVIPLFNIPRDQTGLAQ